MVVSADHNLAVGLAEVDLPGIPLYRRGKVRDTFDLGDRLLLIATDRLSAFDCILPDLIPGRGRILTELSRFWFGLTQGIIPNHLLPDDLTLLPDHLRAQLEGRVMFCRKAVRVDIECVVRGRLAGSGWEEYQQQGTLAGEPLPKGLRFGDELGRPRFTPATKNDTGHDENISRRELAATLGGSLAAELEEVSLALFEFAQGLCLKCGVILVDTKFEFGWVEDQLILIDEALTPDSSRMWLSGTASGESSSQGFDKQLVRDHLLQTGWDRQPPAPRLPQELIAEVQRRYQEVFERITQSGS